MRVRFGELGTAERARLAALDARSDAFFGLPGLGKLNDRELARALSEVHPALTGERTRDGDLVVRAMARDAMAIAERVALRAPLGACVLSHRPARELALSLAQIRRETLVDLSRARFRAGFVRGHLLEVVISVPGGTGDEREREAAERLVQEILGDRAADAWIGSVHVVPAPRGGPLRVLGSEGSPELALESLAGSLNAAIQGLYATLPAEPAWARGDGADWTLLEVEPEARGEACPAQDDLVLAATREPELMKCFLSGGPFSSLRFSRHGELCFYLKYAVQPTAPESRQAERAALEDALQEALARARVGAVIGGGLGIGHSYVNFMLSDWERAFAIVREVARSRKLPERSWILPFDDELGEEWIEVWSEAPAPPGVEIGAKLLEMG